MRVAAYLAVLAVIVALGAWGIAEFVRYATGHPRPPQNPCADMPGTVVVTTRGDDGRIAWACVKAERVWSWTSK